MQSYQQRVVDEQNELQDKATKLDEFIKTSPAFASLNCTQRGLLKAQLGAMHAYGEILALRVAAF